MADVQLVSTQSDTSSSEESSDAEEQARTTYRGLSAASASLGIANGVIGTTRAFFDLEEGTSNNAKDLLGGSTL